MTKICLIPAREGSKRIKNKNIKKFFGKPIIYWSIKAAKKSKCFSRIIVSTDSKKISKIAKKYGAEVPFLRPKNLSGDYVQLKPVLQHAIKKLGGTKTINNVCCVIAHAPLIDPVDLRNGLKILIRKKLIMFCHQQNMITQSNTFLKSKKMDF